ncbi:MAG: hypothetical protein P8184_19815 [Calditrichia bacterium]
MEFILVSIMAGLFGTGGMTLLLWAFDKSGWARADMVRALGSYATRSYQKSLQPGLLIHFAAGIPFAMFYIYVLSHLNLSSVLAFMIGGGVIGFVHGFAFSFVLVILAEHHPVDEFKEAGFEVALAHFTAHVFYGLLVGFVIGATGYLSAPPA